MNILLCTDKSKSALAAISMGGRLATALQADVTLMAAGKKEALTSAALDAAQQALRAFGVVPQSHIRLGRPVDEFIREIRANCYDLAVIGYRRRSALEKAWSGCVAARVAHQSPTSVLIVREGRPDISKILVGIGGNGFTRQMTEWAAKLGSALGASVTLLHVDTAPPLMYAGLEEVHQSLAELLETDTQAAKALRLAADILDTAGLAADIKLAHGVAERELLRTAQEGDYDLIVLGSSWARPSLNRVILSNVARTVLHQTRRPVLVIHP